MTGNYLREKTKTNSKTKNYGVWAQENFIVQIHGAVISTAYGLSILSIELQLQLQLFVTGYHHALMASILCSLNESANDFFFSTENTFCYGLD